MSTTKHHKFKVGDKVRRLEFDPSNREWGQRDGVIEGKTYVVETVRPSSGNLKLVAHANIYDWRKFELVEVPQPQSELTDSPEKVQVLMQALSTYILGLHGNTDPQAARSMATAAACLAYLAQGEAA